MHEISFISINYGIIYSSDDSMVNASWVVLGLGQEPE